MKKITQWSIIILNLLFVFSNSYAQNENIKFRSRMLFPGQTLANICGYTQGGKEYALCGGSKTMIIVDITDPDNPKEIVKIPQVTSLWKEIKVYKNYAYINSEGGGGLQIVDLAKLPSPALDYHSYTGDSTVAGDIRGQFNRSHALHIDVTKGFAYIFGASGLANGGALILDLNKDPYNPTYAGSYSSDYVHDGYVDNDTLYAGHIYPGHFSVVDCTDKLAPVILGSHDTPTKFTHNTWLSTSNRKILFTTDETANSYLATYDLTDLTDIKELDRIQSNPGSNSIIHNTHILNDYAISSYYKDGVTIVDGHRPQNLVQVGNFDAYAPDNCHDPSNTGNGFDGTWGAYPFFPSGTMVLSNMCLHPEGTQGIPDTGVLYVLTPTYTRACYLEGNVTEAVTGKTLNGVTIEIQGNTLATDLTNLVGTYRTGQVKEGTFTVTFFKQGYKKETKTAILKKGELTILDAVLSPVVTHSISGLTVQNADGSAVANARVIVLGDQGSFETTSDNAGNFSLTNVYEGVYDIYAAGPWGYLAKIYKNQNINANNKITLKLDKGYQDHFVADWGWTKTVQPGTTGGAWVIGVPNGTFLNGTPSNPGYDSDDFGNKAYVTGNLFNGQNVGNDDVDGGSVTLTSPPMDLTGYKNPVISCQRWYFNGGGNGQYNDTLFTRLSNGTETVIVEKRFFETGDNAWNTKTFDVKKFIALSKTVTFSMQVTDFGAGHLAEGGLDDFLVKEGPVGVEDALDNHLSLGAMPNPFDQATRIFYDLNNFDHAKLLVFNVLGQIIEQKDLTTTNGILELGTTWNTGVYFGRIETAGKISKVLKLVKQ